MIVERKLTKAQQRERNRLQAKFHVGATVRLQANASGPVSHETGWASTYTIPAGTEGTIVSHAFGVIKVDFGNGPVSVGSLILQVVQGR